MHISRFTKDKGESGKLSIQDFQNAHLIAQSSDSNSNEMLLNNLNDSHLFEGDMDTDESDNLGYFNGSFSDVVAWKNRTWNTKNGPFLEIPYTLPNGLTDSDSATIARAIWEFRRRTCVKYELLHISNSNKQVPLIIK